MVVQRSGDLVPSFTMNAALTLGPALQVRPRDLNGADR